MKDEKKIAQAQAWTGDAVLGLFAREWILREGGEMDAEMFTRMTSNRFLNSLENPTQVEAKIGRIYEKEGIEKAFYYIEKKLIPLFLRQEKKRIRKAGGRR